MTKEVAAAEPVLILELIDRLLHLGPTFSPGRELSPRVLFCVVYAA